MPLTPIYLSAGDVSIFSVTSHQVASRLPFCQQWWRQHWFVISWRHIRWHHIRWRHKRSKFSHQWWCQHSFVTAAILLGVHTKVPKYVHLGLNCKKLSLYIVTPMLYKTDDIMQ